LDERYSRCNVLSSLAMGRGKHVISWSRPGSATGPDIPTGLYIEVRDA
jgi:hypothetical protein